MQRLCKRREGLSAKDQSDVLAFDLILNYNWKSVLPFDQKHKWQILFSLWMANLTEIFSGFGKCYDIFVD